MLLFVTSPLSHGNAVVWIIWHDVRYSHVSFSHTVHYPVTFWDVIYFPYSALL